jgi:hypothetical protein
VLEEVQVPVALGHRVVHRVLPFGLRDGKAASSYEVHADRQHLGRRIEDRRRHLPRQCHAQRGLEQLVRHDYR